MNELDIFGEALQLSDRTERCAYLDETCGSDIELRERIERLLGFHESGPACMDRLPSDWLEMIDVSPEVDVHGDTFLQASRIQLSPFLEPSERADSLGRIGHYHVLEILGQGGFGIVAKAFDNNLHRVVAIKVLAPHMASTSPPRKRFLAEARAAARIKHENVVQIYAVEEQPLPYLVMEYVDGCSLQQKLDRDGPLDLPETVRLGSQIARGLAAAHEKGLIHRDVKPANILLEAGVEQTAKLTDFGLARAADDASLTHSGAVLGTPLYMSPEQARNTEFDHRSDLFSFGSVLYAMVTGRPPFRAPTTLTVLQRVTNDSPRPIRDVVSGIPEALCDIIMRLLQKQPDNRYTSAREVADLLAQSLRPRPRKPWFVRYRHALALCACAVLVACSLFMLRNPVTREAGPRAEASLPVATADQAAMPESQLPQATLRPQVTDEETFIRDREAAELVISLGGRVRVDDDWNQSEINSIDGLPSEPFRLTLVTLQHNKDADILLSHLQGLTNLMQVYMSMSAATDAGLSYLADCTELKVLHMNKTKVTNAGLTHLSRLIKLELVHLNGTQVTDEGLVRLAALPNLQSLAVCGTAISDDGLKVLDHFPRLRELFLDDTRITDRALLHVQSLSQLTTLKLCRTEASDTGLSYLESCKSLSLLDVKMTNVTSQGLLRFQQAVPGCKVEEDLP